VSKLNRKYAIYIPSIQKNGEPVEKRELHLEKTVNWFLAFFGGCTQHEALGSWLDGKKVISEPVTVVYAFTAKDRDKVLRNFARNSLCGALNQDCIAVEIDGALEFIY